MAVCAAVVLSNAGIAEMATWPSGGTFRRTFLAIYDILAEEPSTINARIDVLTRQSL